MTLRSITFWSIRFFSEYCVRSIRSERWSGCIRGSNRNGDTKRDCQVQLPQPGYILRGARIIHITRSRIHRVNISHRNRKSQAIHIHESYTVKKILLLKLFHSSFFQIKKFYQSRKGHRTVSVNVQGVRVPLYGGGVNWSSENGKLTAPVPLNLNFTVKAKAYVLGKLVKPKFYKRVSCAIVYKPTKVVNTPISLKNSCSVE